MDTTKLIEEFGNQPIWCYWDGDNYSGPTQYRTYEEAVAAHNQNAAWTNIGRIECGQPIVEKVGQILLCIAVPPVPISNIITAVEKEAERLNPQSQRNAIDLLQTWLKENPKTG